MLLLKMLWDNLCSQTCRSYVGYTGYKAYSKAFKHTKMLHALDTGPQHQMSCWQKAWQHLRLCLVSTNSKYIAISAKSLSLSWEQTGHTQTSRELNNKFTAIPIDRDSEQ